MSDTDSTQRGFHSANLSKVVAAGDLITGATVAQEICALDVSSINLHVKTLTAVTATTPLLTLQYSPASSGDFWIATTVTAIPSASAGTIVSGTAISNLLAKRVRVVLTFAAFSAGSFQVELVGRAA